MTIREYLKEHILIMDGAMGTYYDTNNSADRSIAEEANLSHPEIIASIHREYLDSGARLLRTNTFAVNRALAVQKGIQEKSAQDVFIRNCIRSAWQIAGDAVSKSGYEAWMAADIGPIPEYLFYESEYDEQEEYRFLIDLFLECGAAIFQFETFSDIRMIQWAADYIKEKRPDAFVMASFAVNRNGYTSRGISLKRLFDEAEHTAQIDCYGCNCSIGAAHMYDLMKNQALSEHKFMQILPNSGYPQIVRGRAVYSDGAAYYGEKVEKIAKLGINILGGCCGTTPKHIRALYEKLGDQKPYPKKKQENAVADPVISRVQNNPFMEKLERGEKVIAVELDPPFDQNAEKLLEGAFLLKEHNADIITLADSPLARARADSVLLAGKVHAMTEIPVMPHIACRDRNRISMRSTLLGAHINGIRNLMIVTGDPVPSGERDNTKSVFDFNSIRLMEYIREMNQEIFGGDALSFGGALNQNLPNTEKVIERMQRKIDAGASWFLTQPVYSEEEVDKIRYIKSRLHTKILCGIMPLVSYRNAMFIKNEMPGILVPEEIVARYDPQMSREEAESVALEICTDMIKKLDGITDGYYLITPFNRVELICKLTERIV